MARKNYSSYSISTLSWLKWGMTGAILTAFIALVWYAAAQQDYVMSTELEAPLVASPAGAVKERPEQPGGMEIPNQDKMVFDLLAGQPSGESASKKALKEALAKHNEPVKLPVVAPKKKEEPKPVVVAKAETPILEKVEVKKPAPVAKVAAVKNPVTKPAPKPVAISKPVLKAMAGKWGVQLASFKTMADAKRAGKKFQSKFPSELGALNVDVQEANLGAKGTYYRVRFIGLANKTKAVSTCKKLKSKGQGCLKIQG